MSFMSDAVHHDGDDDKDNADDRGQAGQRALHVARLGLAEEGVRAAGDRAGQALPRALLQQDDDGQEYAGQDFTMERISFRVPMFIPRILID